MLGHDVRSAPLPSLQAQVQTPLYTTDSGAATLRPFAEQLTPADYARRQRAQEPITYDQVQTNVKHVQEITRLFSRYHQQMQQMAGITQELSVALRQAAQAKGVGAAQDGLDTLATLYAAKSQHQSAFHTVLRKDFEVPLARNVQVHAEKTATEMKRFEKERKRMEETMKTTETRMSKIGRKAAKDLQALHSSIADLQDQANALERYRQQHGATMRAAEARNFEFILQKCTFLVTKEFELNQRSAAACKERMETLVSLAYGSSGGVPQTAFDAFMTQVHQAPPTPAESPAAPTTLLHRKPSAIKYHPHPPAIEETASNLKRFHSMNRKAASSSSSSIQPHVPASSSSTNTAAAAAAFMGNAHHLHTVPSSHSLASSHHQQPTTAEHISLPIAVSTFARPLAASSRTASVYDQVLAPSAESMLTTTTTSNGQQVAQPVYAFPSVSDRQKRATISFHPSSSMQATPDTDTPAAQEKQRRHSVGPNSLTQPGTAAVAAPPEASTSLGPSTSASLIAIASAGSLTQPETSSFDTSSTSSSKKEEAEEKEEEEQYKASEKETEIKVEKKEKADSEELRSETMQFAIAEHAFTGRDERELSIDAEDMLLVREKQDQWMFVDRLTGLSESAESAPQGWIPTAYARFITSKEAASALQAD